MSYEINKEFQKLRRQMNSKMKTVSKTSQGYKSIMKDFRKLFGEKTRITKYMPDISATQQETQLKAIDIMRNALRYNSITKQEQYVIDKKRGKTYETTREALLKSPTKNNANIKESDYLTYDQLMEWIKDSKTFYRFLNAYDSQHAIGYAGVLYDTFSDLPNGKDVAYEYLDKLWQDVERLHPLEKDEDIAERVANTLERIKEQFT